MPPATKLVLASLVAAMLAACSTAPATPVDPVPPPQKPYDAKTQLEYGSPGPRR